jgi:pilus assembly protein CpaB
MGKRQTGGRIRAAIFLLVSLAAAFVASVVIYTVITSYQQELVDAQLPEEVVKVMVAARTLHQGQTIGADDLEMKALPPDFVPDSVLRQVDQAIGRVPRERILGGEFIREERLADPEAGLGLNAIIPRGMRAVSINISSGSAVSGFLNPGNYVDVLVTLPGQKKQGREGSTEEFDPQTRTLLQAVTVLAVNNRLGGGQRIATDKVKPSVTLAVTPEQAEKITHAVTQGGVTLTLRNDIDVTHVENNGAQVENLLGGRDGSKRMTIAEWKQRIVQQKDGSLIIIKGPQVETETTD